MTFGHRPLRGPIFGFWLAALALLAFVGPKACVSGPPEDPTLAVLEEASVRYADLLRLAILIMEAEQTSETMRQDIKRMHEVIKAEYAEFVEEVLACPLPPQPCPASEAAVREFMLLLDEFEAILRGGGKPATEARFMLDSVGLWA